MSFFEYDPSDLQSEEDMTRAGYDELCELRNLIQPIIFHITDQNGFRIIGNNETFAFKDVDFVDIDESGKETKTVIDGECWFDKVQYDSFGLRFVFSETLAPSLAGVKLLKAVNVVVLEGVVMTASYQSGFVDQDQKYHPVSEQSQISSYDISDLLARINDYVIQVQEQLDEDADLESDSDD
jgi:hypothetical protein